MRRVVFALLLGWVFTACQSDLDPGSGGMLPAHVAGLVTINGRPVAGATVRASSGASTVTDASGHYCLAVPPFAEVTLEAFYRPADDLVRGGDWRARIPTRTSDFADCEHADVVDIALLPEPL